MSKGVGYSDFASGTVLDEGEITITSASFRVFDYGGKGKACPALMLGFTTPDGSEYEQAYSCGDLDYFAPSDDGKYLKILRDRTKIHKSSNFFKFFDCMLKAGFDKSKVDDDDIGFIVGTVGHALQKVFKSTGSFADGKAREDKAMLVFDRIISMPGEGAAAAAAGVDSAPAEDNPAAELATPIIMEILAVADKNTLAKKDLLTSLIKNDTFKALPAVEKPDVMTIVKDDAFLKGSVVWTLKAGKLTLAG